MDCVEAVRLSGGNNNSIPKKSEIWKLLRSKIDSKTTIHEVKQLWEAAADLSDEPICIEFSASSNSDFLNVPKKPGSEKLGDPTRSRIQHNIDRISLHVDIDGTITAPGEPLSQRAIKAIKRLKSLGVPISCNTAQSHEYLLAAGGDIFDACVTETGLRVQHADGSVVRCTAPRFGMELEKARKFMSDHPDFRLILNERVGGFGFKFTDTDGRTASQNQVEATVEFVRELAADNDELTTAEADGFIDLCSAVSTKRYGAQIQMSKAPFIECFSIGAGAGAADEPLFEVCDLAVKVGPEESSIAEARLSSHHEMLDVLEWIADVREH